MKKIVAAITFAADYAFGVITVAVGLGIIVGGMTGALWL